MRDSKAFYFNKNFTRHQNVLYETFIFCIKKINSLNKLTYIVQKYRKTIYLDNFKVFRYTKFCLLY